jgi:hypothetical protein
MFQLLVRTGFPVAVAAALLLAAGCGGQSGPSGSGARHSASPTPSSAFGQPAAEPTAHPPVLASPADTSAAYATAADAERFLGANGLSADAPEQTWRPSAVLHVLHATGSGGADYQGDWSMRRPSRSPTTSSSLAIRTAAPRADRRRSASTGTAAGWPPWTPSPAPSRPEAARGSGAQEDARPGEGDRTSRGLWGVLPAGQQLSLRKASCADLKRS